MTITSRMSGTVTIVELQGKMTADHGVREFSDTIRTLLESGHTHIVVDCAHLPYFDSATIGEFVKAYTAVSRRGGVIKIIMPPRPIGGWGGLLAATKVLTVFDVYDTEAEAIASFGGDKA